MEKIDILGTQIIKNNDTIDLKTQLITNGSSYYHTHDYYEVFYMTNGSVTHYFDNTTETIQVGDMFLLSPGNVHCFFPPKVDYTHRDVMISKKLWDETCSFLSISHLSKTFPHKIFLKNNDIIELEKLINLFVETNLNGIEESKNPYTFLIVSQIIKNLIYPSHDTIMNAKVPSWIISLLEKLDIPENLFSDKKSFLSCYHYSYEHICRVFKSYTGKTLTEYINNKRLDYAAVLLSSTNKTIKNIQTECGFESSPYFVKLFVQKFHCTPSEFRTNQLRIK